VITLLARCGNNKQVKMKKYIPNFITSLNVSSGVFAIISAMVGELTWASYWVLAAMFFDYIDGFAARMLNAKSEVGKELDSLGDVVSFGVAPAIILIRILAEIYGVVELSDFYEIDFVSKIIMLSPVILPVFAAFRLARFNVYHSNSSDFTGMPVPSVALYFIAFPLILTYQKDSYFWEIVTNPYFYLISVLLLSYLMVSNLGMFSFKLKRGEKSKNTDSVYQLLLLLFALVLTFSFGFVSIPLIIITYILLSFIRQILGK
jgi:CDP-diacylglycerol--serine O-phosphatidyltransferase